ncbi:MAG: SMC-Scp complex subunit ScpB [Eubacteriales bacterium]|nr:SMC-Scp complex subunit ScpB [Eubacteriales bacterium]
METDFQEIREKQEQQEQLFPELQADKNAARRLEEIVEAVLFAMGGTVEGPALAKACGCDTKMARKAARNLMKRLSDEDGALLVREYDGSFQLCSNPRYYSNLIRLVSVPKKPVLTDVVMETLAIIAFKNPATKMDIERIRGVKSDHAVNRLIEYGLIEETGRLDAPGRPALFAPTDAFYRRFGVSSREELPDAGEVQKEEFMDEVQIELKDVLEDGVVIEERPSEETEQTEETKK